MKVIKLRKEQERMELLAIQDAMRYSEQHRRLIAQSIRDKRGHDLRSQAESRMEGTMVAPVERPSVLEKPKELGEFGLVKQFPAPATEIPVGGGFRLGGELPSMSGKRMYGKK